LSRRATAGEGVGFGLITAGWGVAFELAAEIFDAVR
jgi:hypothetical protein